MTAETSGSDRQGMNVDPTTLLGESGGLGRQLVVTAVAVLLGLAVGAVLIIVSGMIREGGTFEPALAVDAYRALIEGSVWSFEDGLNLRGLGNVMNATSPLILAGLAVAFGFRAGLFNIGANGQFLLGAFIAAVVGANLHGAPFPIAVIVAMLAGALGGAFWGFIPGVLKAWRGAHEVVTTIMLNSTAYLLLNMLASTTFRDPGATFPRTADVAAAAQLPVILDGTRMHAGIIIAILMAVGVWFLLFKTTIGFEVRTVGANPSAARYAGIRPAFITVLTMSLAGSFAGVGGAIEILGITRNYPAEYITTLGFDGIAVALLGRAHPIGVIGAALLFGVLRAGAGTMQRETGIPADILYIVQAVILLFVAADIVIRRLLPRFRARRQAAAAAA